jgi:hypothetical protein
LLVPGLVRTAVPRNTSHGEIETKNAPEQESSPVSSISAASADPRSPRCCAVLSAHLTPRCSYLNQVIGGTNHSLALFPRPSLCSFFLRNTHLIDWGLFAFFHSFLPFLPASFAIAVPVPRPSSTWFDPARRSKAQASRDGHPIRTRRSGFPPFASLVDAGRLQLLQPHATPIQRIRSVALLVPLRVKSSTPDSRRRAPSSTAATTSHDRYSPLYG